MSPNEFSQATDDLTRLVKKDVFIIAGQEAVNHFKRGFQKDQQGFVDDVLEHWPDLSEESKKRKTPGLPILTETSNLHDSITYRPRPSQGTVAITTDVPYAKIHNEGGSNGNGGAVPKRQFMGPSKQLDRKIKAKIDREVSKILNRR